MIKLRFKESMPCTTQWFMEYSLSDFDDYARYAPNVTRVEVFSREALPDGRKKIVLTVYAEGWLPPAVMAFFKQKEICWKEHYIVNEAAGVVDWRIETPVFNEYIDCGGTSNCRDTANGCDLTITGQMDIRTPKIKGIPDSVTRAVTGAVEPFVIKMVELNLKKYFSNLRADLLKKKKSKNS